MGWVCGVNGGRETHTGFCYGNLKERDHLEDLGVSGRVLKLILKKLYKTSGDYCH